MATQWHSLVKLTFVTSVVRPRVPRKRGTYLNTPLNVGLISLQFVPYWWRACDRSHARHVSWIAHLWWWQTNPNTLIPRTRPCRWEWHHPEEIFPSHGGISCQIWLYLRQTVWAYVEEGKKIRPPEREPLLRWWFSAPPIPRFAWPPKWPLAGIRRSDRARK